MEIPGLKKGLVGLWMLVALTSMGTAATGYKMAGAVIFLTAIIVTLVWLWHSGHKAAEHDEHETYYL